MSAIYDLLDEQAYSISLEQKIAYLLEACEYVVNDTPEPGANAQLTVKGYNMLCEAIIKAKGE